MLHLQQLVQCTKVSATAKSKAKCFLKLLNKRDIMQFAALLHDVVSALSVMSQVFQRKEGTAADIHRTLTNVLSVLNKYKTKDGPYLTKLKSGSLCQEVTGSIVQFPSSRSNLLTSLEGNLKKRFSDTDTGVIKATSIVDLASWPSKEKRDVFGDEEVAYVVKHYEESLLRAGVAVESVELEWTLLKNDVYSEPEEGKNLTWPEINRRWKSRYGNVLAVVDLLLCLPSSSAECERGFSLMKNIKTDIRNSLKESSLCDFMVIQLESAPIESFDPTEAIHRWNAQSTRGRRPFFKDDKKPQRHPPILDIPMAEPKGSVGAENTEVEILPAASSDDTEVAVPTPAVEETEVEEEYDQEEGAAVGGKGYESDDGSGDDSGLESDCDDDEETVIKRLMQY